MAFDPQTGKWEYESADVGKQLTGLLGKSSPYLTAARTGAMKTANSRGLLNSSIAAGAGENAAIKSALPIASQNADQISQQNLQAGQFGHEAKQLGTQLQSQEDIAYANIARLDREKSAALSAAYENSYTEAFRTIGQNENLPAKVRDKYLKHLATIRDHNYRLLEQLYSVDIDWS